MDSRLNTKRILIFLAFAVGIPWTATLAFYLTVGMDDPEKAMDLVGWFFLPTPALANVATRLITREGWRHLWLRPNFRRGWRSYLGVWLLPLLVMIPGALAYYLLFPQSFDPNLSRARNDAIPFSVAGIANPWLAMLSYTLQYMVIQGLLIGVVAIGEEFGWRAYLLQRLMDRFGAGSANAAASARKAALLVGVIWSVWHWPGMFIMMTYDPQMLILYPLVYLVTTCSQSVLLSWAALRSGSVWPACIGHTTILGVSSLAIAALKGPANMLLGPVPDTLIGGLGFAVLALVLLFSRKAFAEEGEARPETVPAAAIANPG